MMHEYSQYEAFTAFMDKLVRVPHTEIQSRVEEHREQSKHNPKRRGPKPKLKTSASASDPSDQPDRA